jgi:hypothetical protein
MKKLATGVLIISLTLFTTPRPSLATSRTSGNTKASFMSQTGTNLRSISDAPSYLVTISAGLPGYVLVVTATVVIEDPTTTVEPYIQLYTNAAGATNQPEPTGPSPRHYTCSSSCITTMEWWIDLDAAEAASPGTVYGQTLNEQVTLFDEMAPFGSVGPSMDVSLSAKMVSKN